MQQNRLMKRTAVYCFLFMMTAMSAMLYYCANKIIVVADVAQDEVLQEEALQEESGQDETGKVTNGPGNDAGNQEGEGGQIRIDRKSQKTSYFCIPMPESVKPEEVTIENHYMDRELWVSVVSQKPDLQEQFYKTNSVYGNCENVMKGYMEAEEERFCLRFELTDVYEYHSIFEDHTLYVEFMTPKETYDKIIVIDPAYGAGETGAATNQISAKEITLEIARALKDKLDNTDIKVYYTRMDDSNPSAESRVKLAEATKADMLIRIEVGGDQNTKKYGTEAVYNSRFFIPGFGSVELADLLEREVVTSISGKANGLLEAEEADRVISDATVPAAAIKVGYLTNGQESILLQREDYIQRIAEGIYQAVLKAYENQ